MVSRSRVFAAMTLAVMPVTTGLAASPSFAAEAVAVKGGCWSYVPNTPNTPNPTTLDRLDAGVQRDGHGASTVGQLDWTPNPEGAELQLTTSGATSQGGARSLNLSLPEGPVLDSVDRSGEAHAVFLVTPPTPLKPGQEPQRVIASTPFDVKGGEAIADLTFTTATGVELKEQGKYTFSLQSIFFTAKEGSADLYWVCNGQTETQPTGSVIDDPLTTEVVEQAANPATAPVDWSAVFEMTDVQDVSTLTVSQVVGQTTMKAARPGDEIVLQASGLPSGGTYRLGFGGADGAFVTAPASILSDAAGNVAQVRVIVPEDATVGAGAISLIDVDGKPVGARMDFTVLAAPSLTVSEEVGEKNITLTVLGADFDPAATVRVRSRVGSDAGSDKAVSVTADASGRFEATYVVADEDASAVRALQSRADGRSRLVVRHELENQVPATVVDEPAPTTPPAASTPPAVSTPPAASAPVAAAPVAPPVTIPIPDPVPITEIPGPSLPIAEEASLKVTEARLEGSPSMGELFGGSSRRTVSFEVENTGTSTVSAPEVMLGVGRSTEAKPSIVATELADLEPGARVAVDVNVALPMASFGTYQVVGQVGDDAATEFNLRWDTYPWGLIGVNVAGVALLAWGVNRRRQSAAPLPTGPSLEEAGASVVDLSALDKWWKEGKVVHAPLAPEEDNDSVVDLDAADRWWKRNQNKVS